MLCKFLFCVLCRLLLFVFQAAWPPGCLAAWQAPRQKHADYYSNVDKTKHCITFRKLNVELQSLAGRSASARRDAAGAQPH